MSTASTVPANFPQTHARFSGLAGWKDLARDMQGVHDRLVDAGAKGTAHRLAALDAFAAKTSFNPAEVLLRFDLEEAREELDDAFGAPVRSRAVWRNILALGPLLVTWFSLGVAAIAYNIYYVDNSRQGANNLVVQPFLVAWQGRFGGGFPFTFFHVAIVDVLLLAGVLVLTFSIHRAQRRAAARAGDLFDDLLQAINRFIDGLDEALTKLDPRVSAQQWAEKVDEVVRNAMRKTESLLEDTRKSLEGAVSLLAGWETRTTQLFDKTEAAIALTLEGTDRNLRATVGHLRDELGKYTSSTNELLDSVRKVRDAAQTLADNAQGYTDLATSIDDHVTRLQDSQTALVGDMARAADTVAEVGRAFNEQLLQQLTTSVAEAAQAWREAAALGQSTQRELYNAGRWLNQSAYALAWRLDPRLRPREGPAQKTAAGTTGATEATGSAGEGGPGGVPGEGDPPPPAEGDGWGPPRRRGIFGVIDRLLGR